MNGAIVVNKEEGMTSRDVVNKLNKILNTKKIGHIGTLDPLATGVLVCLIGKYTKLCNILINHDKEYIVSFKLGILTDTLDITGQVLKENNIVVTYDDVKKAVLDFPKEYLQEVPIYSAVKINGKKLYDYARNGEDVELPFRKVNIYSMKLIDYKDNIVTLKVKVSKGTYIRALIRDICNNLGTYGTMLSLERISLDKFSIKESYTLSDIEKGNYSLLSIEDILPCKVVNVDDVLYFKIKNGQRLNYQEEYVLFKYNGLDIALYEKQSDNIIKPLIIF